MFLVRTINTLQKHILYPTQTVMQTRSYAVGGMLSKGKKVTKKGQIAEKVEMVVEKDVNKLVTYCCGSNIYIEGEDVKLKPDSEYPDWLWKMDMTARRIPIEELDPNTKQYWRRVREAGMKRKQQLDKLLHRNNRRY